MSHQSLPDAITLSPEVLFQELNGEAVLLNLQNEHYYGLNEVGTRLLQFLSENSDVASAQKRLLSEFDVEETTLRQDIINLINELAEAGLITVCGTTNR